MAEKELSIKVFDVAGQSIAEISNAPATVVELKQVLEGMCGTPVGHQRIMSGAHTLQDCDFLGEGFVELTLVVDETVLYQWDIQNNPNASFLGTDGASDVWFTSDERDYVNVLSREPVRRGVHYFEFVMHMIGDEQWCGVTISRSRAGCEGDAPGWFYYSGRRFRGMPQDEVFSPEGALHAVEERNAEQRFQHVETGDVIGMLLDMDEGRLAFSLNGKLQGACAVPNQPLYLSTTLDRKDDRVVLRRLPLEIFPMSVDELRSLDLPSIPCIEADS